MPDAIDGWLRWLLLLLTPSLASSVVQAAEPPRVMNDRYQLELVASEPEIVTPVGMTMDRDGRLLVVESHTHKRMPNYQGPAGDRIRMLADSDGDGRLDRWSTFAEGFLHAMNLLARPDGGVYVLSRHSVVLVRDTAGDGRADQQREIIHLESDDDYPHNGLGGIARLADGSLLVCLGENHGFAFELTGSDGSKLAGTGGLDGVIHATADGGQLEWLAHGVWNPFSICVDPRGRMFAVDNDPDASPPCRLLHIVPGGDYGYRFQYGRAGTHPLQAWNGELPGTLPMVCGVGEAPTAIIAHVGSLWVTSWGDNRVDSYRLVPRGASFGAEREIVVQGNADFRPTGMAVAPDGSIYFGDWVLRDYKVHGHGRIWRLVLPAEERRSEFPPLSADEQQAATLSDATIESALNSDDAFFRASAVERLAQRGDVEEMIALPSSEPRVRLGRLAAARRKGLKPGDEVFRNALADESPDVRLYAVRWIADERIVALRDDVAKLLDGPLPSPRYYLAVLGAVDWLDHEFDPATTTGVGESLLVRELKNPQRSPAVHALALRLLTPDNKYLSLDQLRDFLQQDYEPLRLAAVRTLTQQSNPERFDLLAAIARDAKASDAVRAEAIAGLAAAAERHRDVLDEFAAGANPTLAREAARTLRLAGLRPAISEIKPPADDLFAWNALLEKPGDAAAGRRLFFSAVGARCAVCHRFDGRGGTIGPDLTAIARSNSRERIISSILEPSREIAPHYQPWLLVTTDGKSYSGLRLAKGGDDGIEPYADSEGREFTLDSDTIESRQASPVSIMPDGLEATISIDDLRDLVTFLTAEHDIAERAAADAAN
ncbi:MAG: PVC-type heme-binding CxxCH protein [Pirellulales bacterium]